MPDKHEHNWDDDEVVDRSEDVVVVAEYCTHDECQAIRQREYHHDDFYDQIFESE